MRRLCYNAATSLDGFIASPDGSADWIVQDASIDFDALYARFDMYLMGRKTYEAVASYGDTNPLAAKVKESVLVVSREWKQEEHPNITILRHDFIDTVRQLKAQDGRDIWLMGGGQLAALLLAARLIDDLEMAVMPVVLGSGIKMVGAWDEGVKTGYRLQLTDVKRLAGSGIVMLTHEVCYHD